MSDRDDPLQLDPDTHLTTADVEAIARRRRPIHLTERTHEAMRHSHALLDEMIAQRARVYGVTTGYGPLATSHVVPERAPTLQRNLVYHLATGVGRPMPEPMARAVTLARISSLRRGASAIEPSLLTRLTDVLNAGLAPYIPTLGTVGASGDLTPLAHMALAMMGDPKGGFWRDGARVDAAATLREIEVDPIELHDREGLALVNGTSAMTGMAALNDMALERLWRWSAALCVVYAEALRGHAEAWSPELGRVRPHPGQQRAHAVLNSLCAGSRRVRAVDRPALQEQDTDEEGVIAERALLQDAYTIRCAPQILGAVQDVATFHREVVERELNAVTDNPIFVEGAGAIHGGNFYGQHVSFASDAALNAVIKLMVWSERRIARITDPARNEGLPPFLMKRGVGLRSGFMGAQVTASSLVAHARAHAQPASVQSMPTNGDNQDVTSMGTIAALKCHDIIERAFEVLAIEAMVLAQGVELLDGFDDPEHAGFSEQACDLARFVRHHSPFLDDDRPLSDEIAHLATELRTQDAWFGRDV